MTNYSVEAQTVLGGNLNSRICVVPEAPPLLVWNVSVILTDGRISSNTIQIDVVCPNNFYLKNKSCTPCPSDDSGSSFNEAINAPSIQNCRCSPGSYGTFGLDCKWCAALEGFNCSLPDQLFPIICPGYYVNYSHCPIATGNLSHVLHFRRALLERERAPEEATRCVLKQKMNVILVGHAHNVAPCFTWKTGFATSALMHLLQTPF